MTADEDKVRWVSYWPPPMTEEQLDAEDRFYRKGLIITILVLVAITPVLAWLDSLHLSEHLP